MRTSNKSILVTKSVQSNVVVSYETLEEIYESKPSSRIDVRIGYYSENGELLRTQSITISGDNYMLLMSESPKFAPGKPANEYREADLWHVVDNILEEV
ncbi:hypothetical protein [Paenibacillus sp. PDC88]|uniref:hypothetical protein n=1 Tax=Paenibacillus sp. PDC88 TaxID=1884375 RepID=UPI00089657D8|nr:hypothetical protein [Paenibacillus sp. PDC88]SDW21872.1 hypothetical protein SAMN05518848_101690 [Paenibacillus sp. PDC88]